MTIRTSILFCLLLAWAGAGNAITLSVKGTNISHLHGTSMSDIRGDVIFDYAVEIYGVTTAGGYVQLPDGAFPTGGEPRSLSIWFKADSTVDDTQRGTLFTWGDFANVNHEHIAYMQGISMANPKGCMWVGDDATYAFASTHTFSTGAWHNVILTYTNSLISLFVNMVAEGTQAKTVNSTNTFNRLGTQGNGAPQHCFSGQLDEFLVWDRAISAEEIGNVYSNRGKLTGTTTSGIVLRLLMDEGTGTNVGDSSGSENDGTLQPGGTWAVYP